MTPEGKKALSGFWARWHAEDEHLSSEELWQFCNLLCVRVAELEAQVAEARQLVQMGREGADWVIDDEGDVDRYQARCDAWLARTALKEPPAR